MKRRRNQNIYLNFDNSSPIEQPKKLVLSGAFSYTEFDARYVLTSSFDHGLLDGLEDNDHPQYLLLSGSTNQEIYGGINVQGGFTGSDGFKVSSGVYGDVRINRDVAFDSFQWAVLRLNAKTNADMSEGFGSYVEFSLEDNNGWINRIGDFGVERRQ